MGLRINHNIASLNGQKNLLKNDSMLNKSLERLSSGMKINKAADNAAGLVISEQMRAQLSGIKQATDNTSTAINMVQTAEGALDEVSSLLTKARELALHAANEGANDTNQLVADQSELDNIIGSITRISQVTQFGTKKLLDGSLNGASSLGSGINRVKVGNLANNSAVTTGTVTVSATMAREANTVKASGTQTDTFLYSNSAGTITGFATASTTTLAAGSVGSVTIDGTTYSATASGGSFTMANMATDLTAAITAASGGYSVSFDSGAGGFKVTRNTSGEVDFTASVSLTRAATSNVAGTDASYTMNVSMTTGSVATPGAAAGLLFDGATSFTGVTTASVVNDRNAKYTLTVNTSTGVQSFSVSGSTTTGASAYDTDATLGDIFALLEAKVEAGITGASSTFTGGATLAITSSAASGITVRLTRDNDGVTESFNATLSIDYDNTIGNTPEIWKLGGATALTASGTAGQSTLLSSGSTSVANIGASSSDTLLVSGNAISITVNGQTFVATGGAGATFSAVATALNTAVQAVFSTLTIAYGSGGANLSGVNAALSGGALAASNFIAYDTTGANYTISLSVDQAVGSDVAATTTNTGVGSVASSTLNLVNEGGTAVAGTATISGHSAVTISSVAGLTVNTDGAGTATLTTANGVSLTLAVTGFSSSGTATLKLDTSVAANAGFQDIILEINSGMAATGGTATFALGNGAMFQIGANSNTTGQYDHKVGVTIDSIAASELGRNATGAGTINSLADLVSTAQGALLNGKTTEAIKVIDKAVDDITNMRGKLGAFQANTLETNINSLRSSNENLTAAESTIRDTDFAAESAAFTKNQILVQAATSMLAQANQLPQGVLSLLRG